MGKSLTKSQQEDFLDFCTGLEMELLQRYLFVPLDIYKKNQHNKKEDKRDAWIALLSEDEPEKIIELLEEYPEFKTIYEEAYSICRNTEEVMDMFSEELYELDKNTVQYMLDEMQGTVNEMQDTIDEQRSIIEKSIKCTVEMMRKLKLSESEICKSIQEQYQLTKEQAESYL